MSNNKVIKLDEEEEEEEMCFPESTVKTKPKPNLKPKSEPVYQEPDYDDDDGQFCDGEFDCEYDCEFEEEEEGKEDKEIIESQKKIGLMCNCGLNTVLFEVKKEGANKGKMFYTCPNVYDKKCNYFMWKDESDKKIGKKSGNLEAEPEQKQESEEKVFEEKVFEEKESEPEESNKKQISKIDYKHLQKIGLMCYCKLPSVEREVKKDGATKGKKFYTCSKYYDDKCKYFVWK